MSSHDIITMNIITFLSIDDRIHAQIRPLPLSNIQDIHRRMTYSFDRWYVSDSVLPTYRWWSRSKRIHVHKKKKLVLTNQYCNDRLSQQIVITVPNMFSYFDTFWEWSQVLPEHIQIYKNGQIMPYVLSR